MRNPVIFAALDCGLWTPGFPSTLTRAARLARRGKYENAAQLLESEVYNYRDSFLFFYLLGLCSLYAGNYGGAHDYLSRARELKTREPSVLLALAALYVKRADSRRAISFYLEARDIDGKNRIAKRGLNILKKYAGSDDLQAWVESGKLRSLFPPFPHEKLNPARLALIIIPPVLLMLTVGAFFVVKNNPLAAQKPAREGFAESALTQTDKREAAQSGGVYNLILTEKQILDAYENARKFFNVGRDNSARIEINRIMESNAGEGIKNKARIMAQYLEAPDFEMLKSTPSAGIKYAEAAKDPPLYRDCYALWSGMAANIVEGHDETSFDFLIGYDKRRVVEGIVKVWMPFAAAIAPERPLEVFGRIEPSDAPGGFGMEGITIHQPVTGF
ncbi:MAG: tetratricopeptide repeat protein [Spirochaetaceae bacterium]|jgi:tetratricopeptide (TPR) repeat protein|nr:tetratricopeptide repeat protein [Spirochaetaceae bacterium]